MFDLVSKYKPSGDQPEAINKLVDGIKSGKENQEKTGKKKKRRNRDKAKGEGRKKTKRAGKKYG